jgi:sulfide:quinone oxidoreductase
MTAVDCASRGASIEISLITPEEQPLDLFGDRAAAGVRELLEQRGIDVRTSSYASTERPGWLRLSPGDRSIQADAIVTLPRLTGPLIRGIPCTKDGFIRTDACGRVFTCERVYAVGDATDFPVKQGGLAAQQADAAAAAIAADLGASAEPQPFHPILHAALLTGGRPRYLQADISGRDGDDSTISLDPLWWPPNKLCARYLGPYLSGRRGEELDVMPRRGSRFDRGAGTDQRVRA